jgi:hypothetical protein
MKYRVITPPPTDYVQWICLSSWHIYKEWTKLSPWQITECELTPPPQTLIEFMWTSLADCKRLRILSFVILSWKLSAGIQLLPLRKIGTPLILK